MCLLLLWRCAERRLSDTHQAVSRLGQAAAMAWICHGIPQGRSDTWDGAARSQVQHVAESPALPAIVACSFLPGRLLGLVSSRDPTYARRLSLASSSSCSNSPSSRRGWSKIRRLCSGTPAQANKSKHLLVVTPCTASEAARSGLATGQCSQACSPFFLYNSLR